MLLDVRQCGKSEETNSLSCVFMKDSSYWTCLKQRQAECVLVKGAMWFVSVKSEYQ